ncbi:DUF3006 family protein [Alkalibacillus aidingensis]|uniref:DUF3006 family protein n=1 Tax=Alkalibacillus aidingensis TaxID=2747607 RepID=UPI0016602F2C|nr:DUF3006 family protein [Alkalibacillus aidingensis]
MKTYQGVLDRIVDGQKATILIESLKKEVTLNLDELPKGSQEGTWFDIALEGDQVRELVINQIKTDEQKQSTTNRLNRLRSKSKGSKFKKK